MCESFVVRCYWLLEIFYLLVFALSSLNLVMSSHGCGSRLLYGFVLIRRFLLLVFICLSLRCVNRLLYSVVCCMVFWLFLEGFNFRFSSF